MRTTSGEIPTDLGGLRARFLGDSLRYAPAVIVPAMVSVANVIILTRLLNANDYGAYSVALAGVTILNVVLGGWVQQSVLRYLPEAAGPQEAGDVVAHTIGLTAATCFAVIAGLVIGRFVVSGETAALWFPTGALLLSEMSFTVLGGVLQAQLRSQRLAWFRIAGAIVRSGTALGFLLWFDRDIRWLLWGATLGRGVVTAVLLFSLLHENRRWLSPRFDRDVLRKFAAFGVPMVGWSLGSQVLGLSDRFVIGAFHGSGPVGVYSANYNLVSMGFGLLAFPLVMAAHPLIVAAWKRGESDNITAVVSSFSRLYLIVVVPMLVVLTVCADEVVALLLGSAFRENSGIIPVLVAATFVWNFALFGHKGLELAEKTLLMFRLVAITALANIVLNLAFVPAFGYPAAAYTTLASNLLYPALVFWVSRRHVPWRIPWGTVTLTLIAGAAAGGVAAVARGAVSAQPAIVIVLVATPVTIAAYALLLAGWRRVRGSPDRGAR